MKITINPNLKAKFNFSKRFSIFIKKKTLLKLLFFFFPERQKPKKPQGLITLNPVKLNETLKLSDIVAMESSSGFGEEEEGEPRFNDFH